MSTIKDVANLADVSICTVSRVLVDKGYIKPETKEKVLEAARKLQYRPNHTAQNLKAGNTKKFGLVLPDITNMYYPIIAKSIEEYAGKKGYMILLCNSNMSLQKEKQLFELLKRRAVDGVIALPVSQDISHIQELACQGIPYVLVNRDFANDSHCIPSDNFYGGYTMMKYLIEHGHKNICAIFQSFENSIYKERWEGAELALKEFGLNDTLFLYDVNDMLAAHKKVLSLLGTNEQPTAFFASNDMLAAGVYSAAYERKLIIPKDISVVGYDNIAYSFLMVPPLTTFEQPAGEMARRAIDLLIKQLNGDAINKKAKKLRGRLVERKSVANVPLKI